MFYEYFCGRCGEFEAQHSISAPPLEVCPQCEADKVPNPEKPTRLISKTTFLLNGGCWAKDKYSKH